MIRIFNSKENVEISIDDSFPQVVFTPRDYEDIPFVKIELRGFSFHHHTYTCKDCKTFFDAFGTNTLDWFIEYNDKIKRLDLSEFGKGFEKSHTTFKISEFENGSVLKLNLSTLPTSITVLKERLEFDIEKENYEKCLLWKYLINEQTS